MKMTRGLKLSILAGTICASSVCCFADLDEQGFLNYRVGEVLGQNDWLPQAASADGTYINMSGRGEIRRDSSQPGQSLVWLAGFKDREQTRMLKHFPVTTGRKVDVKFDFIPGSTTVGGQFTISGPKAVALSIRFLKGNLHVGCLGSPVPMDMGVKFEPHDWNRLEMQFDFEANRVTVFLNDKSVGVFALPPALTAISQLNIFAGGGDFESQMRNLVIKSVDDFSLDQSSAATTK